MIPLRFRLRGDAVPTCLAVTATVIDASGRTLATQTAPLETSAESDGAFTTGAFYIVFVDPLTPDTELTISASAGGVTAARRIVVRPH